MQLAPSAGLAAALLDDGFARNEPALERQLLRLAVYAINQPLDPITFEVSASLQHTAQAGTTGRLRHDRGCGAQGAERAPAAEGDRRGDAADLVRRSTGALGTLGQQRAADLAAVLGGSHAEALRRHFLGLGSRVVDEPKLRSRRGLGNCLPPSGDNADDAKAHEALREALNKVRLGSSGRPTRRSPSYRTSSRPTAMCWRRRSPGTASSSRSPSVC